MFLLFIVDIKRYLLYPIFILIANFISLKKLGIVL